MLVKSICTYTHTHSTDGFANKPSEIKQKNKEIVKLNLYKSN